MHLFAPEMHPQMRTHPHTHQCTHRAAARASTPEHAPSAATGTREPGEGGRVSDSFSLGVSISGWEFQVEFLVTVSAEISFLRAPLDP